MRRLSDDPPVILNVKIPRELDDNVREFQEAQGLRTRSDATRELLERGLAAAGAKPA